MYCGRCSPEAFPAGAVDEFSLAVTPAEFLVAFRAWLRGPYPGAFELLGELRPHYQLACLSNANALDVQRFRDELRLHDAVDRCFFSNEIGLRKPDADCYRYVAEAWAFAPRKSCSSTTAANASTARARWDFERIRSSAWMNYAPRFDV